MMAQQQQREITKRDVRSIVSLQELAEAEDEITTITVIDDEEDVIFVKSIPAKESKGVQNPCKKRKRSAPVPAKESKGVQNPCKKRKKSAPDQTSDQQAVLLTFTRSIQMQNRLEMHDTTVITSMHRTDIIKIDLNTYNKNNKKPF